MAEGTTSWLAAPCHSRRGAGTTASKAGTTGSRGSGCLPRRRKSALCGQQGRKSGRSIRLRGPSTAALCHFSRWPLRFSGDDEGRGKEGKKKGPPNGDWTGGNARQSLSSNSSLKRPFLVTSVKSRYTSSNPTRRAPLPLPERHRELDQRQPQHRADRLHFPHVEPPLAGLVLAHERLRHAQPVGDLGLRQAGAGPPATRPATTAPACGTRRWRPPAPPGIAPAPKRSARTVGRSRPAGAAPR